MNCSKCGKELTHGDHVLEVGRGFVDNTTVFIERSEAVLCDNCEEEVMPAFWADVNED